MHDFVTCLALWYNVEVKVIQSDNEMNHIKTKEKCNNVDIFFELFSLNTYAQNGRAERFR